MQQQPFLSRALRSIDTVLARIFLTARGEQTVLLSFLFHVLFENQQEVDAGVLDPQQGITIDIFRRFVEYFQTQNYVFVSPDDILRGLKPGGRYFLLTFDDGYCNNLRVLPVLEEFNAPAVFFISTAHAEQGKAFWWDVVFREHRRRGVSEAKTLRVQEAYKRFKTVEIELQLRAEFGKDALRPAGDLDRPLTNAELRRIAAHPLVTLGNHTRDHAILTNYSKTEVTEQIEGAQRDLHALTRRRPNIIAFPNGNCSREIVECARGMGLHLGMTVAPGRNRLPLGHNEMQIKRFLLWGNLPLEAQCSASRSRFSTHAWFARTRRAVRPSSVVERFSLGNS